MKHVDRSVNPWVMLMCPSRYPVDAALKHPAHEILQLTHLNSLNLN